MYGKHAHNQVLSQKGFRLAQPLTNQPHLNWQIIKGFDI